MLGSQDNSTLPIPVSIWLSTRTRVCRGNSMTLPLNYLLCQQTAPQRSKETIFVGQTTFLIRPRCSNLWGTQSCERIGETWGHMREKNRYIQVPLSYSFLNSRGFLLQTLQVIAIPFPEADLYYIGLGYLQACRLTAQRINRHSLHCQQSTSG